MSAPCVNLDNRVLIWERGLRFRLNNYTYEPLRLEIRFDATVRTDGNVILYIPSIDGIGEVTACEFGNALGREVEFTCDREMNWFTFPLKDRVGYTDPEVEAIADAMEIAGKLGIESLGPPEVFILPFRWQHEGGQSLGDAAFRKCMERRNGVSK